jgi:hypothetical protein
METSGTFHAPVALTVGEEALVLVEYEVAWAQEPV